MDETKFLAHAPRTRTAIGRPPRCEIKIPAAKRRLRIRFLELRASERRNLSKLRALQGENNHHITPPLWISSSSPLYCVIVVTAGVFSFFATMDRRSWIV
ncbi:hypothetical protein JTE90_027925 [Oedothorax gibbosus]|uniref:Uncharacterized protein n=1 Tax=Oedothorax gibbosus TaxID=931172 RepID=A0AAV6VHM2_9ARAC|nr:hypothetical protein JTE90_027925 [Oedothorax gibbosus]